MFSWAGGACTNGISKHMNDEFQNLHPDRYMSFIYIVKTVITGFSELGTGFYCKLSSNLYFDLNSAIASKLGSTLLIYP